jgi:hypothetical protein
MYLSAKASVFGSIRLYMDIAVETAKADLCPLSHGQRDTRVSGEGGAAHPYDAVI